MALASRFSRSRSTSRSPARHDSPPPPPVSVSELQRLLSSGKTACNHADQVWPGLYIGDQNMASDRRELARVGITHIVNCAQSRWRSGAADSYAGMNVTYLGIEAHDSPAFDMSKNFYPAADFIHKALTKGGKVLVHCAVGLSRSATLVLAYLMIRQNLTLVEAIKTVKDHRGVTPNRGFLRQLNGLDGVLCESRRAAAARVGSNGSQ
nr:dual specificity protein phosphatase 26-like [Nerophis lumbriciformis]